MASRTAASLHRATRAIGLTGPIDDRIGLGEVCTSALEPLSGLSSIGDMPMFRTKTVFVLGAGASHEVGLPVGEGLKKTIATKLDLRFEHFDKPIGKGDLTIYAVLVRKYPHEVNEYIHACWRVRDGIALSPSIDDFIETHSDDPLVGPCGKVAIACSILEAERRSKLFFERRNIDDTIHFDQIQHTWYPAFYQLLSQGVTKANRQNLFENVCVVAFNYDRCLEQFLVHAVARHYQISIDEAKQLAEKLPIFHPYGAVGPFFGARPVVFGLKGSPDFDSVVGNIRTYTEQITDKDSLHAIRNAISEAEVLVFLGNAFHESNMSLLVPEKNRVPNKKVFATRVGISDPDLAVVNARISRLRSGSNPLVHPTPHYAPTCAELFATYHMGLRT
jgi:hypothetical protein